MMKYLLAFGLMVCSISEGISQKELSDYSFVVVPEKFDFVNEVDKYQLNSLTRFLFNKHGFNAYFDRELPDVRRCDGLYAQVEGKPGIIWTKVTVILNDCKGNEVYRSEIGKSKIKQYSKTYVAALRDAFLSIESLEISQPEPIILEGPNTDMNNGDMDKEENETVEQDGVKEVKTREVEKTISQDAVVKEEVAVKSEAFERISASFGKSVRNVSLLRNNNAEFYLIEFSPSSYRLIDSKDLENPDKKKGEIERDTNGDYIFTDSLGNKFPCSFDQDENLIIHTSFQKLIFTKISQ
ncbi:MAG: hypothetical protein AAFP76_15600 [Bacteroidota bacterium]